MCIRDRLQGQAYAWEKVASDTLAMVEDVDGVVIGMSLAAISEQLMLSHAAIKIQDGCATLRIHELRKVPRFQNMPFPALEPNASIQKSDQSQQPGVYSGGTCNTTLVSSSLVPHARR